MCVFGADWARVTVSLPRQNAPPERPLFPSKQHFFSCASPPSLPSLSLSPSRPRSCRRARARQHCGFLLRVVCLSLVKTTSPIIKILERVGARAPALRRRNIVARVVVSHALGVKTAIDMCVSNFFTGCRWSMFRRRPNFGRAKTHTRVAGGGGGSRMAWG